MLKSVLNICKGKSANLSGFLSRKQTTLFLSKRFPKPSLQIHSLTNFQFCSSTHQQVTKSSTVSTSDKAYKPPTFEFQKKLAEEVNHAVYDNLQFQIEDVNVKNTIKQVLKSNIKLNYYDSLMLLSIIQQVNPKNKLIVNNPKALEQAHSVLKEFLSNPQFRQTLYENDDHIKLLAFLTNSINEKDPLNRLNFWFRELIREKKLSFVSMTTFITKFGFIFVRNLEPRLKPIIFNVFHAIIISAPEQKLFDVIPLKIKENNFKIPIDVERLLLSYSGVAVSALANTPQKEVEDIILYVNSFLNVCTEICHLSELSLKLGSKFFDILSSLKDLDFDISTLGELTLSCYEVIGKNILELSVERFTRTLFQFSRLTFLVFQKQTYEDFINASLKFVITRQDEFTVEQWKSTLYSLGLNSITSPELNVIYNKFIDIDDMRSKRTYLKYPMYLRNLFLNVTNNYVLKKEDKRIEAICDYLVNEVRMFDETSKFYDLASFMKIAVAFRRAEFLYIKFWEAVFNNIPQMLEKDSGLNFDVFYVFKTIELFGKNPESKEEYKEIYNLQLNFSTKHPELYQKVMSFDIRDLATKFPEMRSIGEASGLQHQTRLFLNELGYKYIEEAKSNLILFFNVLIFNS